MKITVLGTGFDMTGKQAAVTAVVVGLGMWWLAHKTKETVKEVANAVNPLNPDNVINEGFNGLYSAVTGSAGTLGTDIYDWLHPGSSL